MVSPDKLLSLIKESGIGIVSAEVEGVNEGLEKELEWAFLGKVAIQTYGLVLETLLAQTLPLSEDLRFWSEVRASYQWTMVYWIQTSPWRLVGFVKEITGETLRRLNEIKNEKGGFRGLLTPEFRSVSPSFVEGDVEELSLDHSPSKKEKKPRVAVEKESTARKPTISEAIQKYYKLVRSAIEDRSREIQHSVLIQTPFALARREILEKQTHIKQLREMQATALGILVGEGLVFDLSNEKEDWKGMVERTVILMENITRNVVAVDQVAVEDFEELVFSAEPMVVTDKGFEAVSFAREGMPQTTILSLQLQDILQKHLPRQAVAADEVVALYGRPSALVRYWAPATALLLSSSTILRYVANRKAELKEWVAELGQTVIDFWINWVLDPVKRIISTIRHDEGSEVALMSRRSLTADMESLERMVVDFALDNPAVSVPDSPLPSLSAEQLDLIRAHVKEGDLSPVLRAYEQELRRPFVGAIRGELVRALLIQIQKTKVDVEVAISGIDRLLKSQELLFGIMGLMPSTLIGVGTLRWFRGSWGGRRGFRKDRLSGEMLRSLRQIDRLLTAADRSANNGLLTFRDQGLLLCEVYLLQEYAKKVLPRDELGGFTEEMEEMAEIRRGIERQRRIGKRVRW